MGYNETLFILNSCKSTNIIPLSFVS